MARDSKKTDDKTLGMSLLVIGISQMTIGAGLVNHSDVFWRFIPFVLALVFFSMAIGFLLRDIKGKK